MGLQIGECYIGKVVKVYCDDGDITPGHIVGFYVDGASYGVRVQMPVSDAGYEPAIWKFPLDENIEAWYE